MKSRIGRSPLGPRLRPAVTPILITLPLLAGCDQLTATELRTILANSATSTIVTAVGTAFTSSVGAILSNVLGDLFKALFGVT